MNLNSSSILEKFKALTQLKLYPLYLSLILTTASLFFATPKNILYYKDKEIESIWETINVKANDLLNPLSNLDPKSHSAKTVFRLTVPIFVKFTHISLLQITILNYFLGVVLLLLVFLLFKKNNLSNIEASILLISIVFIYFGRASFSDNYCFDGWAYLSMIACLFVDNIILIFLFGIIAAFTDERALLMLPSLALFHAVKDKSANEYNNFLKFLINKKTISVIAICIIYTVIRFILSVKYGLKTPSGDSDFSTLKRNLSISGMGIWTFFEGLWLIIVVAIYFMIRNKHCILLLAVLAQFIVSSLIALCVLDITRSGSYIVPIIFIIVPYLKGYLEAKDFRNLLIISAIISFLFPAYYIVVGLTWCDPIYFEFIRHFLK
ncbi:MAG: hypothetical protein RL708_304 [Bacteroidota bacterium]|jgi:hypothetical protein